MTDPARWEAEAERILEHRHTAATFCVGCGVAIDALQSAYDAGVAQSLAVAMEYTTNDETATERGMAHRIANRLRALLRAPSAPEVDNCAWTECRGKVAPSAPSEGGK